MITTARRALIGACALALLLPAVASARPFTVSRDVGVYAAPSASKGVSVIKAGGTVDVQCWTNGQRIGGYPVWDRIAFRGGIAYVHDRYVEMPNGGTPAANGIPSCEPQPKPQPNTQPKPLPSRCVGESWEQYLAFVSPADQQNWDSPYRVRWAPRFCPRGKGDWVLSGKPEIREHTNPLNLKGGLTFELGEAEESADGRTVTYDPRLRFCPSSDFGGACFTAAKMQLIARLDGNGVRVDRSVETSGHARNLFVGFFGWRHKQQN